MIKAFKRSIDFITQAIGEDQVRGSDGRFSANQEKLAADVAKYESWVREVSAQHERPEASRVYQRLAEQVDGYKVSLEEVWHWTRAKGQKSAFDTVWQLAFYEQRTGQELVVRYTFRPGLDREINEDAARATAGEEAPLHTLNYGDWPAEGLQVIKQDHGPVLRIEFHKSWGPTVREDMVAQLCVEALQSGFGQSGEGWKFLVAYVAKRFNRVVGRMLDEDTISTHTARNLREKEELIDETISALIDNWAVPVHSAAFQRYVWYTINGKVQQYFRAQRTFSPRQQNETLPDGQESEDWQDLVRNELADNVVEQQSERMSPSVARRQKNPINVLIDELGISKATAYRWFRAGKVPGVTATPVVGRRPPDYFFGQPIEIERLGPGRQRYHLDPEVLNETVTERLKQLNDEIKTKKAQKELVKKRFEKLGGTRRGSQQWVKRRLAKGMGVRDIAEEVDKLR